MSTVVLLLLSNLFMTAAWYGHLKFKALPRWQAILISWGIAFFEYCLQVPANRWGYGTFTAFQLKIIQEAISITVFIGFALLWLNESVRWNYVVAFLLMAAAVWFAFLPKSAV